MTYCGDDDAECGLPCWTMLRGSDVYERAYAIQTRRAAHVFRSWSLTCRYYRNAQDLLRYEYSRALDLAILTWGSTVCIDTDRGARAISWISEHIDQQDPDLGEASRLLSACANIDFSTDPRLIFVTLSDLADVDLSRRNLAILKHEAEILNRMDGATFYASFNAFLGRLKDKMRDASPTVLTATEQDMHRRILEGIRNLQMHALDMENMERTEDV